MVTRSKRRKMDEALEEVLPPNTDETSGQSLMEEISKVEANGDKGKGKDRDGDTPMGGTKEEQEQDFEEMEASRGWLGARGTRHGSGRDTGTGRDGDEDEDGDEDGDEDEDADENADGDRTWMGMIDRLSHAGPVVGGNPRYIPGRHALCACAPSMAGANPGGDCACAWLSSVLPCRQGQP